ncbi:MAG: MarR family transcriptional regulator [Comamonadaceae bacterium]|nr:MAG: MarR family transcriptional regulator [Comamonadaceae bacterium]
MTSQPKPRVSHHNLPQHLLKARECLMGHFRPILNHFGLTEQQWRILRLLDEYGQLEPREICDQCQFHSASMAGMLARMEDLGLIQRSRVEGDLRRVSVRLAAQGDQLISQMAPLIDAQYLLLQQALGKDMLENLFTTLDAFIAAQESVVQRVELPVG